MSLNLNLTEFTLGLGLRFSADLSLVGMGIDSSSNETLDRFHLVF
jgi:hypothetical protein